MEPSAVQLELYKQYVSIKSEDFSNVTFDWRHQDIDDYLKSTSEKESSNTLMAEKQTKFHFISAIHSAYHFPDVGACLEGLYNLLEDNGVMLIEMGSYEGRKRRLIL